MPGSLSRRPRLLSHLVGEAALRDPTAVAVRCAGESLTYRDLARRANGLARVLSATGLERRDRVAVLLPKGLEVAVAFYGALVSGATLVPIDPRSPVEQVVRILRATGARHLVSTPGKGAVVGQALAACPEVRHVIGLELEEARDGGPGSPGRGAAATEALPWSAVLAEASDRPPAVEVSDLDPAYILHTSGSTGMPKLSRHTHSSAMSFVDWAVAEYSLTREDRLSNHSSHHTCFATFDYYAAAAAGAATVLLTPAVLMMPGSLAALLEAEGVSVWYSVPTALVQLSLRGGLEGRDLSSLRWVLFAGETFAQKHLERIREQLPGARFSHVYGSTETNVCTFYHLPEEGDLGHPLPIGKACPNAVTRVVDDGLRPVPRGEVGELLVRGSTVMSGYWGEPEKNRQVLVGQPAAGGLEEVYFRTGDRVRTLDDGNLTFVARADLQVKVRGFRVELEEVETALLSLEAVEAAAAFAVADGEGSSALGAAVVIDPGLSSAGDAAREKEILDGLKRILPVHAVPAQIAVLGSLPRTPTGKVDRKALQARWTP